MWVRVRHICRLCFLKFRFCNGIYLGLKSGTNTVLLMMLNMLLYICFSLMLKFLKCIDYKVAWWWSDVQIFLFINILIFKSIFEQFEEECRHCMYYIDYWRFFYWYLGGCKGTQNQQVEFIHIFLFNFQTVLTIWLMDS